MYHVAPIGERESILREGLRPHHSDYQDPTMSPPFVYLWPTINDAWNWQLRSPQWKSEVWEVNVDGLSLDNDPWTHGVRTEAHIEPSRLRLTGDSDFEKDLGDYIAAATQPEVRFTFEEYAAMVHQAAWTDVAAKAKRLIQEGRVTIIRNTPTHIMAHVIGDGTDNNGTPDEHDVEITRHDPNSQYIEQANCTCKWWQFSFDRTRKWKKYEQRACSHILATYWKAKSTPLDTSDMDEGYQMPRGQRPGQMPGTERLPGMPPPRGLEPDEQRKFSPEEPGVPAPGEPQAPPPPTQLPSTQQLAIPKAPESPFSTPKTPPAPQHEQLELFDITAPPGEQPGPTPPTVSVPGGRPPTPGSPVQFPGTFSHFIPVLALHTSQFIYAADALTEYFDTQRAAHQPIHVALTNMVALERSGGKIPTPGAKPYGVSSEGIPLYNVMDLGWNPNTNAREKADVNLLQGAPEETGTYSDVGPGRYAEVLDWDSNLKMVYIVVPLNYPDGVDARLHPQMLKGWVGYSDVRPVQPVRSPFRKKR